MPDLDKVATVPKVEQLMVAMLQGKSYETKALMLADTSWADGVAVLVTNDPDPENNGAWIRDVTEVDGYRQSSFDRVAVVEGRAGTLESRATTIEGVNTAQAGLIAAVEDRAASLEDRATAIEGVNTTQAAMITAVEDRAATLESRATAIEGVNATQGTAITAVGSRATALEGRATAIEGINSAQGASITAVEGRASGLESRALALETRAAFLKTTLGGYGIRNGQAYWTPLATMLQGEDGAVFDLTDRTTLFADVGFTTPAVLGGPVHGILDKSGYGRHLTQADAAKAATLDRDVLGVYCLLFPSATRAWYHCAAGGQWASFSVFATVRPTQIAAVKPVLSMRSGANVGAEVTQQNVARVMAYNGTSGVTATPAHPRPLLAVGQMSVIGGTYDGTNAMAFQGDHTGEQLFASAPAAVAMSLNATAGFRVGAAKYITTPTVSFEGKMYGLFVVDRVLSVAERQAVYSGMLITRRGLNTNALSNARAAIEAAAADVHVLIDGDSTGDAEIEWVYKVSLRLAATYPRHTVVYRLFSFSGNAYGSPVTLQTGDNGRTIYIWNSSISLSVPSQVMGDRYAAAVAALPACDLVVWSHGHNISDVEPVPSIRGEYLSAMEQVRLTWPGAHHVAMLQNPRQFDDGQEPKYDALRWIAALRTDLQLVDARASWEARGKASGYYANNPGVNDDPIHPNAAGSDLTAQAFMDAWNAAGIGTFAASAPWLDTTATNELANGDLSAYAGAVPDSWTVSGATLTKDASTVDGAQPHSVKVENAAAAAGYLTQSLPPDRVDALKGLTISTASRIRAPTPLAGGAPEWSKAGVVQVKVTGGAGTLTYDNVAEGEPGGAFRWSILAGIPIPLDCTSIEVRLIGANQSIAGGYAHFGKVVLVQGDIPRDA